MSEHAQTFEPHHADVSGAAALMRSFAERTGVDRVVPGPRYLWTDAFAVCNFLGLAAATGESEFTRRALRLIDAVHHTLGQHRPDDERIGWLSGLSGDQAEAHPTRGGLRIGKPLPERGPNEALDERVEWNRDGQYFHYLTRWMHALDQTARATQQPHLNVWARELAEVAWRAFSSPVRGRMVWKMSIDLSRPQVLSMGQHDPLDGLVTCLQLRASAARLAGAQPTPDLRPAIAGLSALAHDNAWATSDLLGLGGLLMDAYRVDQLMYASALTETSLLSAMLTAALRGLRGLSDASELERPASQRLAFRELGLAIGLQVIARLRVAPGHLRKSVARWAPLGARIEAFWRESVHQTQPSWTEHQDINEVMLATCLCPDGWLELSAPVAARVVSRRVR